MSDLIERAKAAVEGATPGPWEFIPAGNRSDVCQRGKWVDGYICAVESQNFVDDARLIAMAPDLARALIDTTAERDALRERVARLEAALALYSCEDGCNDCPEHERDRVTCGWTALTALQKGIPNG